MNIENNVTEYISKTKNPCKVLKSPGLPNKPGNCTVSAISG